MDIMDLVDVYYACPVSSINLDIFRNIKVRLHDDCRGLHRVLPKMKNLEHLTVRVDCGRGNYVKPVYCCYADEFEDGRPNKALLRFVQDDPERTLGGDDSRRDVQPDERLHPEFKQNHRCLEDRSPVLPLVR